MAHTTIIAMKKKRNWHSLGVKEKFYKKLKTGQQLQLLKRNMDFPGLPLVN